MKRTSVHGLDWMTRHSVALFGSVTQKMARALFRKSQVKGCDKEGDKNSAKRKRDEESYAVAAVLTAAITVLLL